MKTEHNVRVSADKKLEETEQALVNLAQENAALQTKVTKMDKIWGAKLEEAQNKLQAAEAELLSLKQIITQMLTAIFGKSNTCFLVLTHLLFCIYVQTNPTFYL